MKRVHPLLPFLPRLSHLFPFEQDKAFDKALFRVAPVKKKLTPSNNKDIRYHPMLEATDCVMVNSKKAPIFKHNGDDDREYNAFDYPACEEYATQPACDQMHLNMNVGKPILVSDRNGIKVKRVLKAFGKFFDSSPPAHIQKRARDCWPEGKIDWRKALGENCFFTGWESCTVHNDGAVELVAREFE
jgi:hypothetical protein